jgi:hypothetical protein
MLNLYSKKKTMDMDELNSTQQNTSLGRYLMCLDSLDLSFVGNNSFLVGWYGCKIDMAAAK